MIITRIVTAKIEPGIYRLIEQGRKHYELRDKDFGRASAIRRREDADEEPQPGPSTCSYPGCGKTKAGNEGGWMHEADGTDWCPEHWRFDSDGWMRPATWFGNNKEEAA